MKKITTFFITLAIGTVSFAGNNAEVIIPKQDKSKIPFTMPKGVKEGVDYLSKTVIFRVKEQFRLRYPKGHFWSRGYMARTVGLDEEKAIQYVLSQQAHHGVEFL